LLSNFLSINQFRLHRASALFVLYSQRVDGVTTADDAKVT